MPDALHTHAYLMLWCVTCSERILNQENKYTAETQFADRLCTLKMGFINTDLSDGK